MKKLEVCPLALFLALLLPLSTLMAQETSPPDCCPNSTKMIAPPGGTAVSPSPLGEFAVSDEMLELQGITRSQFLDRLSESLFPGQIVDLVLVEENLVVKPRFYDRAALGRQNLMAVKEAYYYRVPLFAAESEDLDQLDKVGLTDGSVYVTIRFVNSTSPNAN